MPAPTTVQIPRVRLIINAHFGALLYPQPKLRILGSIKPPSKSLSRAPTVCDFLTYPHRFVSHSRLASTDFAPKPTTKTPLLRLVQASTVQMNWAVQSTPPRLLVAIWATNTSPSVRARATTPRPAPMHVTYRRHTIASTQPRMVVTWHA